MSKKDIDSIIDEVMTNIRNDREVTKELLGDAMSWLSKDESRHREIGIVLSKYVETLQRSNEQLVKIANMVSKDTKSRGLSDEDKSDLLDMISGDKEDV
jgi:hypothetical protein